MVFTYENLKKAAKDGIKIGKWNGKSVFAVNAHDLDKYGSGAYYVLYNDNSTIVALEGNKWYEYGTLDSDGSVNEYSRRRLYDVKAEPQPQKKEETSLTPGYDVSERPIGDVKSEIDVENVLKNAREMAVENLLEGFLPGLSYDVVG
jgi:hypothetical protein